MRTHFTWSIEESDGKCPFCGVSTVLVVAMPVWEVDEDDVQQGESDAVEVVDEVSGHFCRQCRLLVSLSLNTEPAPSAR